MAVEAQRLPFDAVPLTVEAETPAVPRIVSGRGARTAAALLVPLSVLLIGLRLAGMMPHSIHLAGAMVVGTFFLLYPAFHLARKMLAWRHRLLTPAADWDATPEPRWVVWNWAWWLSLLWILTIPLLGIS